MVVIRAQELCESRGGRPGLLVTNKPRGFCGRKATLNRGMGKRVSGSEDGQSSPLVVVQVTQYRLRGWTKTQQWDILLQLLRKA